MEDNWLKSYKTSKDYSRLKTLLDNGHAIVTIRENGFPKIMFRLNSGKYKFRFDTDVSSSNDNWPSFTEPKEDWAHYCPLSFEELCEKTKLEFLDIE